MSQQRNEPCLCGSGKKYKKCCGAQHQLQVNPAQSIRTCGTCKKCCEGWLSGHIYVKNIIDFEMKRDSPCPFSGEYGCSIYQFRPANPCKSFMCGWLIEGSPLPEDYRPDKLGIIFLPIVWRQRRAWVITPAGREPSEELMAQMRSFSNTSGEPHLIKSPGKLLCFGSVEFKQDMVDLEQRGMNPWDA
jgi:hypothetical protein